MSFGSELVFGDVTVTDVTAVHPCVRPQSAGQAGDRQLLQQCIEGYRGLVVRRFTHPEITTADLHVAALNVALSRRTSGTATPVGQDVTAGSEGDREGMGGDGGVRVEIPAGHCCHTQDCVADGHLAGMSGEQQHHEPDQEKAGGGATVPSAERKRQILKDMEEQRKKLRDRLGKPVTAEALRRAEQILDKYPRNFRPARQGRMQPGGV